ncbi:MAG: DEAD/DEAH box helicase [Clostridia bacterium]|nr:DEAD/DEAH box helicase [Clostridia bacterium]
MYFDLDALYAETRTEEFSSGKRRYYDDKVKKITTAQIDDKFYIYSTVAGVDKDEYSCKVVFDGQGGLYDYACSCDGFSLEKGPCRHIVATALSFEEKRPSFAETSSQKKKSDAGALNLISEYAKMRKSAQTVAEFNRVEIVPQLKTTGGVSLRFTIGAQKQYILKDISEFVSLYRNGDYKRYGVKLEFYHTGENFTDQSRKLAEFIVKSYYEKVAFYGPFMREKDELRLDQGDLDDFMSLYEGALIRYEKDDFVLIEKFEKSPPLKIEVKSTDGGYDITLSGGTVKFIEGSEYFYALVADKFYRVGRQFARVVKPFVENLQVKGKFFISSADTPAFYNSVLVKVSSHIEVVSDIDLTQFESSPLHCAVYLSATGGRLNCETECDYDGKKIDLFGEVLPTDFVRDWESENAIRGILARYFPHYPRLYTDFEEEIYDFLTDGVRALLPYAEVFMGENMKKFSVRRAPKLSVGVRLNSDLMEIGVSAPEYTSEQIDAILSAYKQNRRYIKLDDGFVTLDDEMMGTVSELLDDAIIQNGSFVLPRYYAPMVIDGIRDGMVIEQRDQAFSDLATSLSLAQSGNLRPLDKFDKVMRHYQKVGYGWLKTLKQNGFGGILADDMGLGKTLQALALFAEDGAKSIVVCPTTLMYNWASEVEKFAPELKTLIVVGNAQTRRELIATVDNYDLIITSYDLMRRDYEEYEKYNFDYAVADEAQYVKNPETKNATAVKRLNAKHRFAMTGTPIENHLGELWSLFDFIMPSYLGSYAYFRENYESAVVGGDEFVAEKLKRLVRPFVLRRLKSEVLTELPQKSETIISVPMDSEQEELYKANLSLVRQSVQSNAQINRVVALSMLMKLRQICCDPRLAYADYDGQSVKTDTCISLIKEASDGGHKILVFSQFTKMLDILAKRLTADGVPYYMLKGDTPKAERLRLVNKFNSGEVKVFLISLKAGGTGINLTGADVVIHYDPWWNESAMNQATDRAYRIGQNKPVTVYKLIAKDSVEEKIIELGQRKSELSSLVVGENNDIMQILDMLKED